MLKGTIEFTGSTESDVESAVEEALTRIKAGNLSGSDNNDSGSFTFTVSGTDETETEAVVAVVYDPTTGAEYDRTYNWESAQCYAQQNYRVVALTGDGHLTQDEVQRLCDYERRLVQDCFSVDAETVL